MLRSTAFVAFVICLAACQPAELDLTLVNATPGFIQDAHVEFDGFRSIGGSFSPGISKTHGGIRRRLPEQVRVTWRDAEGNPFAREVTIPAEARRAREVEVRINGDGSVAVLPR